MWDAYHEHPQDSVPCQGVRAGKCLCFSPPLRCAALATTGMQGEQNRRFHALANLLQKLSDMRQYETSFPKRCTVIEACQGNKGGWCPLQSSPSSASPM